MTGHARWDSSADAPAAATSRMGNVRLLDAPGVAAGRSPTAVCGRVIVAWQAGADARPLRGVPMFNGPGTGDGDDYPGPGRTQQGV